MQVRYSCTDQLVEASYHLMHALHKPRSVSLETLLLEGTFVNKEKLCQFESLRFERYTLTNSNTVALDYTKAKCFFQWPMGQSTYMHKEMILLRLFSTTIGD